MFTIISIQFHNSTTFYLYRNVHGHPLILNLLIWPLTYSFDLFWGYQKLVSSFYPDTHNRNQNCSVSLSPQILFSLLAFFLGKIWTCTWGILWPAKTPFWMLMVVLFTSKCFCKNLSTLWTSLNKSATSSGESSDTYAKVVMDDFWIFHHVPLMTTKCEGKYLNTYSKVHKKYNNLRINFLGGWWFCSYFQGEPTPINRS